WAAGTPGIVCSTFIWLAAQRALHGLTPHVYLDRDPQTPTGSGARQQMAQPRIDGLYHYGEDERKRSGQALHDWIAEKVERVFKQTADKEIPALARFGVGMVIGIITGAIAGPVGGAAAAAFTALALSPATMTDLTMGLTQMP